MMRCLVIIALIVLSNFAHAGEGKVKESGYRIPLYQAMDRIAPKGWLVKYTDLTLRTVKVGWTRNQLWTDVLNDIGYRLDINFLCDANNKVVYVNQTENLRTRGSFLVANARQADKFELDEVRDDADRQMARFASLQENMKDEKSKMNDLQHEILLASHQYKKSQESLLQNQSEALGMGIKVDGAIGNKLLVDRQIQSVKLDVRDLRDNITSIETGEFIPSLNEYFNSKWNYKVQLAMASPTFNVSIPYDIRLPGLNVQDDVIALSQAFNTKVNPIAIHFNLHTADEKGNGGFIEVSYAKKSVGSTK